MRDYLTWWLVGLALVMFLACTKPLTPLEGTFVYQNPKTGDRTEFYFKTPPECGFFHRGELGGHGGGPTRTIKTERRACTYKVEGNDLEIRTKDEDGSQAGRYHGTVSMDKRSFILTDGVNARGDETYNGGPLMPLEGIFVSQKDNPYAIKVYFKGGGSCELHAPRLSEDSVNYIKGESRLLRCSYETTGNELRIHVDDIRTLYAGTVSTDARTITLTMGDDYTFIKQETANPSP